MVSSKSCKNCRRKKPLGQFYFDSKSPTGRTAFCRKCIERRKGHKLYTYRCPICRKRFSVSRCRQRFCSLKCFGISLSKKTRVCTRCKRRKYVRTGFCAGNWLCRFCHLKYKKAWRKRRHGRLPFGSFLSERASNWRLHAEKVGVKFSVSREYLSSIWKVQRGRCFYTGKRLTYFLSDNGRALPGTASLDRLNPEDGYVPGNLAWVCHEINQMKRSFPHRVFVKLCKSIGRVKYVMPQKQLTENVRR